MIGMLVWEAAAAALLLAWGALELWRLRRVLERYCREARAGESWERLRLRQDQARLARRVAVLEDLAAGPGKRGEEAGTGIGEQMSEAMLEGFDNLMSYTERTARGERS